MTVVADSSPLVVLVNIGHIEVLPTLFQHVVIPPEVALELASPKRPQVVRDFIAAPPPWLELKAATTSERIKGLHSGEAAAIALAEEQRADRVLLDEQQARKTAAERRLRVIGTIGVLEAAAERNLIDLGRAFDRVKQTDFWVTHKFLAERLTQFRERQLPREQKPN
jgi:predicted nucleic acid-binding protein